MLRHLRGLQCSSLCRAWARQPRAHCPPQATHIATPRAPATQRHRPLLSAAPHWLPSTTSSHHSRTCQRLLCHAKKSKSKPAAASKPPKSPQPDADEDALLTDLDDADEYAELDFDGEPFDEGEDDDDPFGEGDDQLTGTDDSSPAISLGGAAWGDAALQACREALQAPGMEDLDLYAFRVVAARQRIDVRLDNLEDYYGSPTLDQVAAFSRVFYERLQREVGEQLAGEIDVEVSSPGAEREIRVPADLERFQELPMKVQYVTEAGAQEVKVLALEAADDAASTWRLADVKANSPGKGRKLSKKLREQLFEIPLERIRKVNLHIDY